MARDRVRIADINIPARLDIGVLGLSLRAENHASIGHHRGHADFGHGAAVTQRHADSRYQHRDAVAVAGIDCLRIVHLQIGAVSVEAQRDRVRAKRREEKNRERR